MMNGVDVDALGATIEAVRADPEVADFEFRLANQWVDGGLNRSTIDDFRGATQEMRHTAIFELVNDEPAVLLSGDKGPNPVEYVLHALAGCLTTSLVYHAAARGIAIRGVRTRFTAPLDLHGFLGMRDDVRRGFQSINVVFDIDADLDEAGKEKLIEMAQRYSPVFDIVSNGVPVACIAGDASAMPKAA
jgi:uncharacterized OsmC-like protein